MSIKLIKRAVREGRYEFTSHALEEMDEDGLSHAAVRWAFLHGRIVGELSDDPRGIRFVVRGLLRNNEVEIELICRFLVSGLLRIITVYALER